MKKYMINSAGDLTYADDKEQESLILPADCNNIEYQHTDATDPDLDWDIEPLIFHRELIRRLSLIQKLAYNV